MQTTFKGVNSGVKKVIDTLKEFSLKLWDWRESASFTIVPMNVFEVVLGQEFTRREKEGTIPHLENLSIFLGERPCMVPVVMGNKKEINRMTSLILIIVNNQGAK
jgi:hypothetical protein